ncbi:MAG: hypothetical protein QOH54_4719 [Mycobacterium sp.]|nr:hypothetical protein [Mycobacterium sp.]
MGSSKSRPARPARPQRGRWLPPEHNLADDGPQPALSLDDGIARAHRQAAAAAARGDMTRHDWLIAGAGGLYLRKYRDTGSRPDLDKAIAKLTRVLAIPAGHHRMQHHMVIDLADALTSRGRDADLDKAIRYSRPLIDPTDVALCFSARFTLGHALSLRAQLHSAEADLDEAIHVWRRALEVAGTQTQKRVVASNLGGALRDRFERTGDLSDLDAAIELLTTAAPGGGIEGMANLGAALGNRFQHRGGLADLQDAIRWLRQAADAAPAEGAVRAACVTNLGLALRNRYSRLGEPSDIDEAIDYLRQAVAAAASEPDYAGYLANLANCLSTRFESQGADADINEAIDLHHQALDIMPDSQPDRIAVTANVCAALQLRYMHQQTGEDLGEAIDRLQAALAQLSPEHYRYAPCLVSLADCLALRAADTLSTEDRATSGGLFRQAAQTASAPPTIRVRAARHWGRSAFAAGEPDAMSAYALALELLTEVASRGLARADQEYGLAELSGLAAEAVACFLQAGDVPRAIQCWEQGRGVLLAQALETRTDLTDLRGRHPGLADEFDSVTALLEVETLPPDIDRHQLATRLATVLADIRLKPDFAGFLTPPPVDELLAVGDDDPVVLVNVDDTRSDAIVVAAGEFSVVPLLDISPAALAARVESFEAALLTLAAHPADEDAEAALSSTLAWLWDVVCNPVFEHLGITGAPAPGEPYPRLWWCPGGPLSMLPLHAAGRHNIGDTRTVMDRVVSSYTPTLRGLTYARRPRDTESTGAVVVSMPQTPQRSPLRWVVEEAAVVAKSVPGPVVVLSDTAAVHDKVSAALADHAIAHLACHAEADLVNPSASRLLLHDHVEHPLTVLDVARLRLDDADMAFLSACSTARTAPRLGDEAVHLSSAFQIAGYRHAIATLWPVEDRRALNIARWVYEARAASVIDPAAALHDATRRLRKLIPDRPSVWAAHIHSGA